MLNRIPRLPVLVFNLILVFTFTAVNAAIPVVHISPKPNWLSAYKPYNKGPAARDVRDGAYDELIEEQVNVEKEATYNHFITVIVSEAGVQDNSEISASFDPSYQRLDFHEIIVWRNNKPQIRLDVSKFKMLAQEDELEKFIYDGTYSAKYILPDIRKGDKIEYSYTITGSNPIFNHRFCRSIYLQGGGPMMHQYSTLLYPSGRKMNIKSFNLKSQPRISTAGGFTRYEWEDFNLPGITSNKLQPKWINDYARVQISEFNTWTDVVNWGLGINPLQTTFKGELADTIARLKQQAGNDKGKYFRLAVTLVQDEVRYMGIETGEYSHKANLPENVFKQRYGDCKDKSLLLASILNAGGIEAHLVLVNTDLQDKIEDYWPSPVLFDHAVVVAMVNNKQVWIDATIAYQGGKGTDLYFPPYKVALIIKPGNTGLTKIKETKTGKVIAEEKYNIKDEHEPVKFKVTTTYTLDQADYQRDHLASKGIAEIEKGYLDFYSKTFSKIEKADSLIVKDDRDKNELTIIENYKITNFFKKDSVSGKYDADFYADDISYQLPQINGQINTPVSVNYPYAYDLTVNIFMPGGWDIDSAHYTLNRDAYHFSNNRTVKNGWLSLHYQFTYLKDYIPLDKLSEFKQDIKNLKDDQLGYSFFYIPDIKKEPFKLNAIMVIVSLIVCCIAAYLGLKIYKTETIDPDEFKTNRYPMALGGWLIVLVITLVASPLRMLYNLHDQGLFSTSKWDLYTTGTLSVIHRALLIFDVAGYFALMCISVFCLLLVVMKRDIAPHYVKGYYLVLVSFLLIDCIFNAVIDGKVVDGEMTRVIQGIVLAVLWTYYLNTSERVRRTFVMPYPD